MLGADDDCARTWLLPCEGDGPLQPACGEHARRPGAGNEAGGARPLAAARRQDQGPGGEGRASGRGGHVDANASVTGRHAGDGGLRADVGAGGDRRVGELPGVGRSAHGSTQVAQAVPGMVGVPGDAAGLVVAIDHDDVSHATRAQVARKRQPGRTGTDDDDVRHPDPPPRAWP